jgi:ATP-dependent Clp protease ATP-binding subunit ClpB
MELEKYTERSKGFIQSAQNLALRSGHQRLMPEHLLKVLLEDKEGLCANLIRAAGGDPQIVLAGVDAELDKQPKVEGAGAGQVYLGPMGVVDEAVEDSVGVGRVANHLMPFVDRPGW